MMRQGMNTLKTERTPSSQTQGITGLGSMEEVPMVPNGGIQNIPDAAQMLADAGRYGDVYVVHASEGETLIPEEVLEGEEGARIRESLYRQMRQMGADPERYVVGNSLNSINPDTGLPEFFFKKVFKKIKSFFKKAAPVILPIALTPFIGPIAAGAVGSGIGSLIQGGSAKDALKAAAFGGLTAGVVSGISGVLGGATGNIGTDFIGGVRSGLPGTGQIPFIGEKGGFGESSFDITKSAFGDGSVTGTDVSVPYKDPDASAFTDRFFDSEGFSAYSAPGSTAGPYGPLLADGKTPAMLGQTQYTGAVNPSTRLRGDRAIPNLQGSASVRKSYTPQTLHDPSVHYRAPRPAIQQAAKIKAAPNYRASFEDQGPSYATIGVEDPGYGRTVNVTNRVADTNVTNRVAATPEKSWLNRNLFEGAGDFAPESFGGTTKLEYALRNSPADQAYFDKIKGLVANKQLSPTRAKDLVAERLQGGTNYKQYLGPLALLGIGSYAGGAFDTPKQVDPISGFVSRPIDEDLVAQNRINTGTYERRAPIQFSQFALAAHGGEMQDFPRRNGAISGPGTEKSDDIPAMLSDGEFVLTAKAVRGAGNGSRRQGVKNLYNIMRNFEAAV